MFWIALLACTGIGNDTGTSLTDSGAAVDCADYPLQLANPSGELEGGWDSKREHLVFFGGNLATVEECETRTEFGDETWYYLPACNTFVSLGTSGPSARGRFMIAMDPARDQMLLFGGRYRDGSSGTYTLYGDIWALDLASETWTELSPTNDGPSERVNGSMAVTGDMLVLFGGNTSTSGASYNPQDDVWSLDLNTLEWTDHGSSGGPDDKLFHAGAMSEDGATYYIYSGGDENAFIGNFHTDAWALTISDWSWTELDDGRDGSDPLGRLAPILVHDAAKDRLVMFGGHDDGALGNTNDTWALDLGGGGWSNLIQGDVVDAGGIARCEFPPDFTDIDMSSPERRHQGVGTKAGNALMVFGGKTDCGLSNDIWSFDLATDTWTEDSAASAGESCLRTSANCTELCF
jgi:hypothetical protein